MSHDAREPFLLEQRIAEDPTIVFRHPDTVIPADTALDLSHLPHLRLFLAFGSQTHTDLGRLGMRRFPHANGWLGPVDAQLAVSILAQWTEEGWRRFAEHPSPDVRKVMAEATGFLLQALRPEAHLVIDSFATSMMYTRRRQVATSGVERLAPVHAALQGDEDAAVRAVARAADVATRPSDLHDLSLREDESVHRAIARNAASPRATLDRLVPRSSTATRRWLAMREGLSAGSWDTLVSVDDVDVLQAALLFAPPQAAEVAAARLAAKRSATGYPLDVSLALARSTATRTEVLDALAGHADEGVRIAIAASASPHVSADTLQALANDASKQVRMALAKRDALPHEVMRTLVQDPSADVKVAMAARGALRADVSATLLRDRSFEVHQAYRAHHPVGQEQQPPTPAPADKLDTVYDEFRATIGNLEEDFVLDSTATEHSSVYVIIHKDVLLDTIDWAERTHDFLARLKATAGDFEAADVLMKACPHGRIWRAWMLLCDVLAEADEGSVPPPEHDFKGFWRTFTNLIAIDAEEETLRTEDWLAEARDGGGASRYSPFNPLLNVFKGCYTSMSMAPSELADCAEFATFEDLAWFTHMDCAWAAVMSEGIKIAIDTGLANGVFGLTSASSLLDGL